MSKITLSNVSRSELLKKNRSVTAGPSDPTLPQIHDPYGTMSRCRRQESNPLLRSDRSTFLLSVQVISLTKAPLQMGNFHKALQNLEFN